MCYFTLLSNSERRPHERLASAHILLFRKLQLTFLPHTKSGVPALVHSDDQ